MPRKTLLGCVADDVTGATDLATNLVGGGLRVVQALGQIPETMGDEFESCDAVVVALKTRSVSKQQAIDESISAVRGLQNLGAEHFYFKYCSTFDSTPEGNIGPVAEALLDFLHQKQTIFCPAFPRAGRTVYQGHLFVGDQLLHESGMQHHPLNPMKDANLVRFLNSQTNRDVGLLDTATIQQGTTAIQGHLNLLAENDVAHVITDTCLDSDLAKVADAVYDQKLLTGGSGLGRYLPDAYRQAGWLDSEAYAPTMPNVKGKTLVVAGSCSKATNAQVGYMEQKCPTYRINIDNLMTGSAKEFSNALAWTKEQNSSTLLIASTANQDRVGELQNQFGAEKVAAEIENCLAGLSADLVANSGFRRLILAGGETSGAIVNRLGVKALRIGPEICAGVPWTETIGGDAKLALALKSGNFGDVSFFETAMEMLP